MNDIPPIAIVILFPLLFSAVHHPRLRTLFWLKLVEFEIGAPPVARLQLSRSVMSTMPGVDLDRAAVS